jgi:oxygen-independent coproporphyrinogen III oxidase
LSFHSAVDPKIIKPFTDLAGIYIHIPFCRQACHYCNFHFSTSLRYKNDFIAALLKELELFASVTTSPLVAVQKRQEKIETIYFGGGTPSLLTSYELQSILDKINDLFPVDPRAEITLEANPDDISSETLAAWEKSGINRLSIGVQSFFEEDLQWMNRAHNAKQAAESLQQAILRFPNLSMDLIYGTPQLTNEKWKYNVEKAISLGIPHLSCYALTVEPKTPLYKMIREKQSPAVDPDKQSEQFLLLMQWLENARYEHYEISNFAKPGFRSRHNSSYWKGQWYFGFGPSAHSFDGRTRWWNAASNSRYIQSISEGIIPLEKEELTEVQRINEYIMISLRTCEGLDLVNGQWAMVNGEWAMDNRQLTEKARKYEEKGLLVIENGKIKLTKEGKLLADGIAADLFFA